MYRTSIRYPLQYVIDPGFCKQNSYNPRSGMESLQVGGSWLEAVCEGSQARCWLGGRGGEGRLAGRCTPGRLQTSKGLGSSLGGQGPVLDSIRMLPASWQHKHIT